MFSSAGDSTSKVESDENDQDPNIFHDFHVQPCSLSEGYEKLSCYEDRESRFPLSNHRLRRMTKWRHFKKKLDGRRLCQAVTMNDADTVLHLLNNGVSPNYSDCLERTPLHIAACKGYKHIVDILLMFGANPNAQDSIGNTPLHLAACTHHIDVIMLLLKGGTNALTIDRLGRSPLQLAESKLRILQKSDHPTSHLKEQVLQVIDMLLMFSSQQKDLVTLDSTVLEMFQNNMKLSGESRQQFDNQLQDLLDNLSGLSIDPSGEQATSSQQPTE